jgi:hypothetical protein
MVAGVFRRLALLGGAAALLSACGSSPGPRTDGGADGQLCSLPPTCSGYCNRVGAAACDWKGYTQSQVLQFCLQDCTSAEALIPADCLGLWSQRLACAACSGIQCPRQTCTSDGTVCIDQGLQVVGCDIEERQFQACAGICLRDGITAGGGGTDGSFEITSSGCACPASLQSGKAAGEACNSSSECAEICCGCSNNSHGRNVIRACKNGQCLGDPGICTESIGGFQLGQC